MSDQQEDTNGQKPTNHDYYNRILRGMAYIKRSTQKYRANLKEETPEQRAGRRTANATCVMAFFTLVAIAVGYFQWRALYSTDDAIREQARIMKGQLSAIQADQRPWIAVETRVAGPLQFDADGMRMPLSLRLRNVGRSPAFNVIVAPPQAYLLTAADHEVAGAQGRYCNTIRRDDRIAEYQGMTLFPGEDTSWDMGAMGGGGLPAISLRISEIQKGLIAEKVIDLWFYGCVDYTYGMPSEHHQTGFIFRVGKYISSMGVRAQQVQIEPTGIVQTENVILYRSSAPVD